MTDLLTLDDLDPSHLDGTRVFVRVDFNVPLSSNGEVMDATRLEEALPTIRELTAAGAKLLLASHHGRPKAGPDPRYSLRPVAARSRPRRPPRSSGAARWRSSKTSASTPVRRRTIPPSRTSSPPSRRSI
jgi:hypothetical protein